MEHDTHPNNRFYIEIGTQKQAIFTEVSGLQVEMDVDEYAEGGNNEYVHRLPGRTKVSNITLKRGISCSNDFFKWYSQLALGKIERRNVSVVMYDPNGEEQLRWNFVNAFPVKWIGPQFEADGTTMAIETLELAHDGLTLG